MDTESPEVTDKSVSILSLDTLSMVRLPDEYSYGSCK